MHRGILHQIVNVLNFWKEGMFCVETICFEGERKKERRKGIKEEIRGKKYERKRIGGKMCDSVKRNELILEKKNIGEGNLMEN